MPSTIKSKYSGFPMLMGHIAALVTIIMWGLSFISTKVLMSDAGHQAMSPIDVYFYRFILAYLATVMISHKRLFANNLRDELLFVSVGLTSGTIYFLAENYALQYTSVSSVSLLTSTPPMITMLIVGILYPSQRPTRGAIIGSVIAFVGVGCVIFNAGFKLSLNAFGDFLALMAALSQAIYTIVLARLNVEYDAWFITRKTFFYGVITALPFIALNGSFYRPAEFFSHFSLVGNMFFLVIGASTIGFCLWAYVVNKMGAVKANNYLYLQPIVTLIASVLILNEVVTVMGITGCALILGGLWLGSKFSKK